MRFLTDRCAGRRLAESLRNGGYGVVEAQIPGPVPRDRTLPHDKVATAVATIRATRAHPTTRLALEFLVLTAARSGEGQGRAVGRNRSWRGYMDHPVRAHEARQGASRTAQCSDRGGAGKGPRICKWLRSPAPGIYGPRGYFDGIFEIDSRKRRRVRPAWLPLQLQGLVFGDRTATRTR